MVYKHIPDISYTVSSVDAQKLNPENLIDSIYIYFEICNKGMFIWGRGWMPGLGGYSSSTFPEANFGPALARSWAKGAGSRLGGPALYPYIHKVNFNMK